MPSFTFKRRFGFIVILSISVIILYTLFTFKEHTDQSQSVRRHIIEPDKMKMIQVEPILKTGEKHKDPDVNKTMYKNRTIWQSLPRGTQMGEQQVAAITKVLPQNGNLLVWGLGNDSPFWHDITQGKVIFIEPKGFWFDKMKNSYPYLEAYPVKYTTVTEKSFEKYINNREIWSDLDLRPELPLVVTQTQWDVIIVDAPPGYKGAPGRYQSIYTSSLIAKNGTHIFVDDYERKVEREFSLKMLGTPVEVVHRKAKGIIGANQQAHFIYIKRR
jgi:uncharacterized protein (TIGR01627 family)